MELKESNFEQLCRDYFDNTPAEEGANLLRALDDDALAKTLDSHWLREPLARDIERRDAVDHFLSFVSMLEVASLAGCIPEKMVQTQRAIAWSELLNKAAAKRYYINFYPLALPQLFRNRIAKKSGEFGADRFGEFSRFLELSGRRSSDAVETFLWMVDDGVTEDGCSLSDVLATFADRRRFVAAMAKPPSERAGVHLGLHGLLEFLAFSRDFERLLDDCEERSVLQSAFWHYHGYWYRQMGPSLVGIIGAVIERYRNDVDPLSEAATQPHVVATYQDMDAAQRSMRKLVSGLYSAAIDQLLLTERRIPSRVPLRLPASPALSPFKKVTPFPSPTALEHPGSHLAAAAADARPTSEVEPAAAPAPAPTEPPDTDSKE